MDERLQSALALIEKERLIVPRDVILAAVSGGGDSVGLLLFLWENKQQLGISQLIAAHVNHGLRPEADEEEAFVCSLCQALGIALNIKRLSPDSTQMPEEWARRERYAFLQEIAAQTGAKIAAAHTEDDQAETVLFHLARGTFVHGAAGMRAVNGNVIRPFLQTSRADIRHWLSARGQTWCEDATNATMQYARGRVRHHALPALEEVHPGAKTALVRFSQEMRELSDWLGELARALLEQAACGEHCYDAAALQKAPVPVQREAVRLLILQSGAKPEKTALCKQICAMLESGGATEVSSNCVFRISGGRLCISAPQPKVQPGTWQRPFSLGEFTAPNGKKFKIEGLKAEKENFSAKDRKKALNFWADYDMISDNTQFRTKQPGDLFCPAARNVTKPLRKWYSEAKIPREEREKIPVLAKGSEILWVPGWGVSRTAAVSPATKRIAVFCECELPETYG